jgi:hypothetical protein
MKRVGVLLGGMPHGLLDNQTIPPSQRLMIAHYDDINFSSSSSSSSYTSSMAYSDSDGSPAPDSSSGC